MIEMTSAPEQFKTDIREFFHKQTDRYSKKVARNNLIYASAQPDANVYFIESGLVKLVLSTPDGKECLLAMRTNGEIFGELCLSGRGARLETAIAMEEATIKQMPIRAFLEGLRKESLLENLVQYLAIKISEQQEVITAMATVNCEIRLARTLLYLGRNLGHKVSNGICIKQKISHRELSEMIGTTRPRVGTFLKKFRDSGLVTLNAQRFFVINPKHMENYISQHAFVQ